MTLSPDLRFLDSFGSESFALCDGGEEEAFKWNFRAGILGFFASSARRWQTSHTK